MKFEEVLPALKGGRGIRRAKMPKNSFLAAYNKRILPAYFDEGIGVFSNVLEYTFRHEDIFAEDWEVVE